MIFYGRKVATKDIDIVFTNAEDLPNSVNQLLKQDSSQFQSPVKNTTISAHG
jgi:hypothetical protein